MRSIGKYFVLAVVFCCGGLFLLGGCEGQQEDRSETIGFEIDRDYERGPFIVHVRLDKDKVSIAETLYLELEARNPEGFEIAMPKVDEELEDFGIVSWENKGERLDENNNVVTTYRYRLEPFMVGRFSVGGFTFEFSGDENGKPKKYQIVTEAVDVEVASVIGEDGELAIAEIEDVVEMRREVSLPVVGGVVVGACIIFAAIGWLFMRRKRGVEVVSVYKAAHEIAYELLEALAKDDLIAAGKIKEFYERISNILRHYIEDRFELMAPERTTEEFLAELEWTDVLSGSDKEYLGRFLGCCDLVKFAKYDPEREQVEETFGLAKEFIDKTAFEEKRIEVGNV